VKRLFTALFVFAFLAVGLAQSDATINDVKARRMGAPTAKSVRTAFNAIATDTKTVSAVWTFSATPIFSAGMTVSDTTSFSVVEVSDSAHVDTLTNSVFSGTFTMANGATLTNPHADTLKVTDAVFNVSGALTVGSDPAESVTAIDTTHSGRWVKITIAGVDFFAVADTSLIVN